MASSAVSRSRGGSSRSDFVGVEPRLVSPAPSERRPSQMAGINLELQAIVDEWDNKDQSVFEAVRDCPSILCSTSKEPVSFIDLTNGRTDVHIEILSVFFPWMQVTVHCCVDITLERLKAELFERLKRMKVDQYSMEPSDYVFRSIRSTTGELEPLYNEECMLYKLNLTVPFPVLFLYEPEGAQFEKEFAKGIGQAINYPLESLEQDLSEELKYQRAGLWEITNDTVQRRASGGYCHYAFPEEMLLDLADECPPQLLSKIHASKLHYAVYYRTRAHEEQMNDKACLSVNIPFEDNLTPQDLITRAMTELKTQDNITDEDDFLLQLAGRKTFLTRSDRRLVAYISVRSSLSNYVNPVFVLRRKDIVLKDYPKARPLTKPYYVHAQESKIEMENREALPSLWTVDENMVVRPVSYSNMGSHHDYNATIVVTYTFFVGPAVIASVASKEISPRNPRWFDPGLNTGIYMKDVPEAAILCIRLYEVKRVKSKKAGEKEHKKEEEIGGREHRREDTFSGWPDFFRLLKEAEEDGKSRDKDDKITIVPVGYANLPVFDWKGEMQIGTFTISLWPGEAELPPTGRIGQNENGTLATQCRISFDVITTVASRESTSRKHCCLIEDRRWKELYDERIDTKERKSDKEETVEEVIAAEEARKRIEHLLRRRFLGESLTDDDETFAWDHREMIAKEYPDALLILMETKNMWETRETFGWTYAKVMWNGWGRLSVEGALTILSGRHNDRIIRNFATQQLDKLLDGHDFALFLLPLLQALKSELRVKSSLVELLLKRALSDYRIGHKFFWLARAELLGVKDSLGTGHELYKRFALLIEAYLRGNEEHLLTIVKQIEMVEFLSKLTVIIKTCKEKDAATKRLREELRDNCLLIENIDSPLDPTNTLGELIIDKCKVLGSAKLPLRLTWKNVNPLSQHTMPVYEIIFKSGDDLRQDMLVLQVLEIMNNVWKKNQLDCCLNPYPVLPTGTKVGMIGVVPNCSTIFEIQSEGGKMGTAVKSLETTFINKYVRGDTKKKSVKEYLECVDRFLMSCVGYSVATFIMGIKDRHNDNIMLTKDGKLFHIDFGHILGHGKTKLGIQRDRVPFVLTEHFLSVIRKGNQVSKESHEVVKFRQLCIDAYLMLWDKRFLFLSLFTAMRSMELPELSTDGDLDHLKKTLRVDDVSRDASGQFFSDIFDEAFNGSWSTKTNWFFHTVKHL